MSANNIKVNVKTLRNDAQKLEKQRDFLKMHEKKIDKGVKYLDKAQSTTAKKLSHAIENTKDNFENGLIVDRSANRMCKSNSR